MTCTCTTRTDLEAAIREYLDVPTDLEDVMNDVIGDLAAEVARYELVEADELRAMAMRAEELIGERIEAAMHA